MSLGAWCTDRRTALGWSRTQLAKRAGVNPSTIRGIELELFKPQTATLYKLSRILGEPAAEDPISEPRLLRLLELAGAPIELNIDGQIGWVLGRLRP